jgi:hypothetical protein
MMHGQKTIKFIGRVSENLVWYSCGQWQALLLAVFIPLKPISYNMYRFKFQKLFTLLENCV